MSPWRMILPKKEVLAFSLPQLFIKYTYFQGEESFSFSSSPQFLTYRQSAGYLAQDLVYSQLLINIC